MVHVLSQLYSKLVGREINSLSEIIVTVGATEALHSTILGFIDEGDEVIIIEPSFDCYVPMIKMAGGVLKYISLKPVFKFSTLLTCKLRN